MWNDIYKPDSIGSEGGTIIADEEYKESCRITLERCERYDAITCGVYGSMMHTAFCDKSHSQEVFDNMKNDLQAIIAFLESKDFEDAVRNAVSLGGDTDTLGAITGSIAERMFQSRFTQTRR